MPSRFAASSDVVSRILVEQLEPTMATVQADEEYDRRDGHA